MLLNESKERHTDKEIRDHEKGENKSLDFTYT